MHFHQCKVCVYVHCPNLPKPMNTLKSPTHELDPVSSMGGISIVTREVDYWVG